MHAGEATVVFNGEIYNFREIGQELAAAGFTLRTRSDTEVLLQAYRHWGESFVERLRGMFALALWDARQEKLVLARDRFGKKPLFLARRDGGLAFGSEIKSLKPLISLEIEPAALGAYFAYRYVPGPKTFFRGVEKLPPGTLAVWQAGRLALRRYWTPPDGAPAASWSGGDPVVRFRDALDEAVAIRMVSDVPFGAFLSGGLDSSAIVALMARHNPGRIETFSVGFAEKRYSELGEANRVARHVGTRHHELTVNGDDFTEILPLLIRARDAPVPEPSDIALYRLAMMAARTVKMVLTGEGADELLGGYPKHPMERYSALYRALAPGPLHRHLLLPLVSYSPVARRRARIALTAMGLRDEAERYAQWFGALDPEGRRTLLRLPEAPFAAPAVSGTSALRRIFFFDQTSWLPDNLLERGDRVTMAASLEARMPFLDHVLAGLVSTLPDRQRVGKTLLRRAVADLVPAETLSRRKVGFRAPVGAWLRGSLRGWLSDTLLSTGARTRELYRNERLGRIVDEHMSGRVDHDKLLWTMLSLELFYREYRL